MLNLDADLAEHDFQQVAPVSPVGPEDDFGIREHLKLTAVRDLENTKAIGPRHNNFQRFDRVSAVERPCVITAEHRNLAREAQEFGGSIGIGNRRLGAEGRACREQNGSDLNYCARRWP